MEVSVEFWGSTPATPVSQPNPQWICVYLAFQTTRGGRQPSLEYQGHETYSAGASRREAGRPSPLPQPAGAPDGPFRRCPEPPVVLFDALSRHAPHSSLTDWQPRPAIGGPPAGRPRAVFGWAVPPPAGRPPWPGGPRARALQTPLRSSQAERSVATETETPACPSGPPTEPAARSATPAPRGEGTPPAERRGLRQARVSKPPCCSGGPPHRVGRTASLGPAGGRPNAKSRLRHPPLPPGLPG
ncbi:hypothetical protein Q5P01_000186 [Channa striata]|uniref:Uncharacterized protein n=1 Tax=Channa striata TaxID=64152 RepID=A0AA88IDQ7_CHASR|nr:hypothetical protein Q5P01_000186 [Channa striata]